ncbi:hypothetical protein J6590_046510 [Homalodisca vitripennis]|nr:hypothetical protein J6590_046510 [Homalodisca vitripennis]
MYGAISGDYGGWGIVKYCFRPKIHEQAMKCEQDGFVPTKTSQAFIVKATRTWREEAPSDSSGVLSWCGLRTSLLSAMNCLINTGLGGTHSK